MAILPDFFQIILCYIIVWLFWALSTYEFCIFSSFFQRTNLNNLFLFAFFSKIFELEYLFFFLFLIIFFLHILSFIYGIFVGNCCIRWITIILPAFFTWILRNHLVSFWSTVLILTTLYNSFILCYGFLLILSIVALT